MKQFLVINETDDIKRIYTYSVYGTHNIATKSLRQIRKETKYGSHAQLREQNMIVFKK